MTTLDLWIGVYVRIILPVVGAMVVAAWVTRRVCGKEPH